MKKFLIMLISAIMLISMVACSDSGYKVTVDDQNITLYEPLSKRYDAGEQVIIKTHIATDVSVECFVNGKSVGTQTAIKTDDGYHWEFYFEMPAEDVTITFEVKDGFLVDPPNNDSTENNGDTTTDTDGNDSTETGGDGSSDNNDDGMVRTVLDMFGAPSLPHSISAEINKRCLISAGTTTANVYLGHPKFYDNVAFSEFNLSVEEAQNCTFSIVVNYNGEKSVTVAENIDYISSAYNMTTSDLYDGNEYKGTLVHYSKYHAIDLDVTSMTGVSYGYLNLELHMTQSDGAKTIVMSDILYYSVVDAEVVFGLCENPVLHEGEQGVITNGWTYIENNSNNDTTNDNKNEIVCTILNLGEKKADPQIHLVYTIMR